MKKAALFCLTLMICICSVNAQFGKIKVDPKKLGNAAGAAATAITLTDADVAALCQDYINWMDAHNPVCDDRADNWKEYADRFERLTKDLTNEDGLKLDFKVYCVQEQNAFACANGSIRVLAGLMDVLTDDELLGVIGHEIGHIKNGDIKAAIKAAYMTMAAKGAIASTNSTAAKLSDSQFGQLTEALIGAQYSQKQEYAADDYGYNFLKKHGHDQKGMASALRKIEELQGKSLNTFNQLFSSHPDSGKRAQRLEDRDK